MKKATISILTGVLMLVALCIFPFSASAEETVSVSIPVEIEGGGTAVVISEVNCPLPETSSVEVQDGTTENININFSVPGDYTYMIQAESKEEAHYSPEYYTARVAIRTGSDDKLTSTVILTKADSDYKPDRCLFANAERSSDEPTTQAVTPTQAGTPTQAVTPTQAQNEPPTSRPKTGDDSMLDIYLLICIAASGGLLMLSIIYSVSTSKLIGKK